MEWKERQERREAPVQASEVRAWKSGSLRRLEGSNEQLSLRPLLLVGSMGPDPNLTRMVPSLRVGRVRTSIALDKNSRGKIQILLHASSLLRRWQNPPPEPLSGNSIKMRWYRQSGLVRTVVPEALPGRITALLPGSAHSSVLIHFANPSGSIHDERAVSSIS